MKKYTDFQEPKRPVVRWHGGKWILAPWIISHFPDHRIYVEPYGGGGSVLLRKHRSYAEVYNDLDDDVVQLFRVLRSTSESKALVRAIKLTPFSRIEFNEAYQPHENPIERARRTIIRSMMGFSSDVVGKTISASRGFRPGTGFRANSNRSGTTPARDFANYPNILEQVIERLRGVVVEHRDALECMAQHDSPETLFYADPPYPHSVRSKQRGSYNHEMTEQDHERLLDFLKGIKGYVVLSGYQHPLYDSLGWNCVKKKAFADGALERTECLWLNPKTAATRQGLLL